MRYLRIVFIIILFGCSRENRPSNPTYGMSADINGIHWVADSINTIRNVSLNKLGFLEGSTPGTTIELGTTLPETFSTGIYNFRPSGIDSNILLYVYATQFAQESVTLHWGTPNDSNLNAFTIGQSIDGIAFSTIGILPAKDSIADTLRYRFVDVNPVRGGNIYRITATTKTDSVIFSQTLLSYQGINPMEVLYNNTLGDSANVHIISNDTINLTITGTFSFDCMYQNNLMQIRNGKFNVHY